MSITSKDIALMASRLQVELNEPAAFAIADYVSELLKWNQRIRLVGPKTAQALADEHIADALAAIRSIDQAASQDWLDIGSGAGLPALILAMSRPKLRFWLVEPIAKKTGFLKHIRRHLQLKNVVIIEGWMNEQVDGTVVIEDKQQREFTPDGPVSLLSRATLSPTVWVERAHRWNLSAKVAVEQVLVMLGPENLHDACNKELVAKCWYRDSYHYQTSERTNLLIDMRDYR